jgi:hypothetical protein
MGPVHNIRKDTGLYHCRMSDQVGDYYVELLLVHSRKKVKLRKLLLKSMGQISLVLSVFYVCLSSYFELLNCYSKCAI